MADSQENKQKEQNDVSEKNFMIEKIKERPVNKKKLLRRTFDHGFYGSDFRSGSMFHISGIGTGNQ